MNKLFYLASLIALFFISSCGENKQQKVQIFSDTFVGYVNANQIDSIKTLYPTANFDSIASLSPDSVQIAESEGFYHIDFGSGKWIEVKENEEGSLIVEKSKGLAAFPTDKVEIAKKTGMWDDNLNDNDIATKISDEDFFKYIEDSSKKGRAKLLSIRGGTVTNISDKTIDGNDYKVIKSFYICGNAFYRPSTTYSYISGKTLKPGESMRINLVQALMGRESLSGIKWQIPEDEITSKYIPFTGNEYQEYLDSKK